MLGTRRLGTERLGTGRLGTGMLGTRRLGTGRLGTCGLAQTGGDAGLPAPRPARPKSLQAGATGGPDNLISRVLGTASPLPQGAPRSSAGISPGLWWGEFITSVTAGPFCGQGVGMSRLLWHPLAPVVGQGTQTPGGCTCCTLVGVPVPLAVPALCSAAPKASPS